MIKTTELGKYEPAQNNRNLGRGVTYKDLHGGKSQHGVIKSWNDETIFVVFKCDNNWGRYSEYTGESCNPHDLFWGWI